MSEVDENNVEDFMKLANSITRKKDCNRGVALAAITNAQFNIFMQIIMDGADCDCEKCIIRAYMDSASDLSKMLLREVPRYRKDHLAAKEKEGR
ncbi:MAG: hypothetical protein ACR2QH_15250 [Geminicoccaceae bacterium]